MSETQLDRIEAKVCKIELILTGNGHPQDGLISKVTVLETREKDRRGLVGILVGVIATGVVGLLCSLILK